MVFGNHNRLLAEHGNNQVKLMGYHATIRGGDGQDRLIADQVAKFSQLDGGAGDDLLVLGVTRTSSAVVPASTASCSVAP